METPQSAAPSAPSERLLSLDFFRGLTMFLLIGESTRIYERLVDPVFGGTIIAAIGTQFHHHPWNGLRFWDLIQPFFMFIVGAAIPFSVSRRLAAGESRAKITRHAVMRAFLLLLLGWALYCIEPGRITFRFQNVLAQLSVTYLLAYLIMRKKFRTQFAVSLGLLAATELIYRLFPVAGYNQPFVPDHNFGAYVDMLISGELSSGHWVSFNAIPTAAHTIWGVLAGQWLMRRVSPRCTVRRLVLAGVAALIAGYSLGFVTPIIKRIATSSFVIASGGWCLLVLGLSYWIIDIKKIRNWTKFFAIVGMNSLFIYLVQESGGTNWLLRLVTPFADALFSWWGKLPAQIVASLGAWALLWSLCFWLYKRRIFIKI
jgi:predicted acyltransferase